MKLLLAEDEKELSNAICTVLKYNNYLVDAVYDGEDALEWACSSEYDLIILDIMMPKLDGLSVLKSLRESKNNTPVLIMTAKSEVDDRVLGLDLGADDYICKPFNMKEFLARVRSVIRRNNNSVSNNLDFNGLILDRDNSSVVYEGKISRLCHKEFQIMEMLMVNKNSIVSTERFMDKIWGYDSEAEINGVWVYISYLRKKLLNIDAPVCIKASRGVGYKLEVKE